MPNVQNSYEFQNLIRDLSPQFQQLITSQPILFGMIPVGAPVKNTKTEWLNDVLSPKSVKITSFGTDGTGTIMNCASTTGLEVGMLLRFESSAGVTRKGQALIATIESDTQFTITRNYGATLDTLVVNDIARVIGKPMAEGTDAIAGVNRDPSTDYNYTQIFERTARVSRTAQQMQEYGIENMINYQVGNKLTELMYDMNSSLIHNYRAQRTASVKGTFGGVLRFVEGGNVESTGGAISSTIVNNAFEKIFNAGGVSSNYALLMNTNQSRKVSAFNTAGTNPLVTIPQSGSTGNAIYTFVSDLAVSNGFSAKVVVDPTMPKDQILILDMNAIEIAYLQTMKDMDATLPGGDYFQRRILCEMTLRMKNATQKNALITGLNV